MQAYSGNHICHQGMNTLEFKPVRAQWYSVIFRILVCAQKIVCVCVYESNFQEAKQRLKVWISCVEGTPYLMFIKIVLMTPIHQKWISKGVRRPPQEVINSVDPRNCAYWSRNEQEDARCVLLSETLVVKQKLAHELTYFLGLQLHWFIKPHQVVYPQNYPWATSSCNQFTAKNWGTLNLWLHLLWLSTGDRSRSMINVNISSEARIITEPMILTFWELPHGYLFL